MSTQTKTRFHSIGNFVKKEVRKFYFWKPASCIHSFIRRIHFQWQTTGLNGLLLCLGLGRILKESSLLASLILLREELKTQLSLFSWAVLRYFWSSCGGAWNKILNWPHESNVFESIKYLSCSFMSTEFKRVLVYTWERIRL